MTPAPLYLPAEPTAMRDRRAGTSSTIIGRTREIACRRYGARLGTTALAEVVIGIHFTGVRLSSGCCGMAQTELAKGIDCFTRPSGAESLQPGHLRGRSVGRILADDSRQMWLDSLQLAVLNAMSAELLAETPYRVLENQDPLDLLDPGHLRAVCLVGAFPSYVRRLAAAGSRLQVLELNPDALPPDFRQYYVPAANAPEILPRAETVVITGSTLANHTLDELLDLVSPAARVLVVGPTCSMIPDVLFESGVQVLGAIRITDGAGMLRILAEGGSAYNLFPLAARKVCLINERT